MYIWQVVQMFSGKKNIIQQEQLLCFATSGWYLYKISEKKIETVTYILSQLISPENNENPVLGLS